MKKFLLSTILPAIALMALNSNAATSLTNFGALTISWTILQQNEPLTEVTIKTNKDGSKATNSVYTYKATTSSSTFGNAGLLTLLSNSFKSSNYIMAGDKLATDGENIYVVDKTGSNVVVPTSALTNILTWTYSNSITSGAATITTNKAESKPVTNITSVTNISTSATNSYTIATNVSTTTNIASSYGTNVTLVTNVVEMTNIVTTNIVTTTATNIDEIVTTTITNYVTNYTYLTNVVDTGTNYSAITNVVISGTNYTTNIDENVSGTNITYTTNVIPTITYSNMIVPITTNVVMVTNIVYATNLTYSTNYSYKVYSTNIVDTTLTDSGTAAYTTTSYFTLKYNDPATTNEFTFHGLASTAIDVNLAKNTGTENFTVKSGVGTGWINGKVTLMTGTLTGSAKGAASPPPE